MDVTLTFDECLTRIAKLKIFLDMYADKTIDEILALVDKEDRDLDLSLLIGRYVAFKMVADITQKAFVDPNFIDKYDFSTNIEKYRDELEEKIDDYTLQD